MSICRHCRRRVREREVRDYHYPWSSEGGPHVVPGGGCQFCVRDPEQEDAARDAAAEHRGDLERDGDAA